MSPKNTKQTKFNLTQTDIWNAIIFAINDGIEVNAQSIRGILNRGLLSTIQPVVDLYNMTKDSVNKETLSALFLPEKELKDLASIIASIAVTQCTKRAHMVITSIIEDTKNAKDSLNAKLIELNEAYLEQQQNNSMLKQNLDKAYIERDELLASKNALQQRVNELERANLKLQLKEDELNSIKQALLLAKDSPEFANYVLGDHSKEESETKQSATKKAKKTSVKQPIVKEE